MSMWLDLIGAVGEQRAERWSLLQFGELAYVYKLVWLIQLYGFAFHPIAVYRRNGVIGH